MLDFFRRPEFWILLSGVSVAMVLNGYWWASGIGWRRAAATSMLLAGLTLIVAVGTKVGLLAACVAAVTGIIVAAMGLEFGADRAPSHAVVMDTTTESAEIPDSQNLKRAS